MRTRMYGGVGGRKTKVGGKPTFCFPPTRFLICILLSEVHVHYRGCDKFVALGIRMDAVGAVE